MKRACLSWSILGLLFVSLCAEADRLRCGRHFIKNGDTKYEVLKACGEPEWKDRVFEDHGDPVARVRIVEDWSDFPRQLTFNGGRVSRIDRLDQH